MKLNSRIFLPFCFAFGVVGLTWAVTMAESPDRLESGETFPAAPDQVAIQLPEPAEAEEASKAEESAVLQDPLENLVPESFSQEMNMDIGFGAAYGGGGPGIVGGDASQDSSQMVRQAGEVDRLPRLISRSALDYPAEAKSKGLKGFVLVRLLVGLSGQVEDIQITQSEPVGVFDQAVKRSVRGWHFEPGLAKGQAAAMWIEQKVKFELE